MSKNRKLATAQQPRTAKVHKLDNRPQIKVQMVPRNTAQESYIGTLLDDSIRIVIGSGSAGTGKSYLATLTAIDALRNKTTEKIIITRPMVEVENEKVGFLPGDLNAKLDPWVRPIFDIFEEFYSRFDLAAMIERGVIEVCPLAYMRGRTFKNAYIILDEAQNCTPNQMLMALTRIGENSRIIVTGDTRQGDRKGPQNGLLDLIQKASTNTSSGIAYTIFDKRHVVRDKIVQTVLDLYGED